MGTTFSVHGLATRTDPGLLVCGVGGVGVTADPHCAKGDYHINQRRHKLNIILKLEKTLTMDVRAPGYGNLGEAIMNQTGNTTGLK